ncbi:MAG TPA: SGNH/GDSL hydrolase family protein [Terriglobales bacterium]|nr:SGNH/GDSL hydrolase family protein [Terriglobales bacterium]
MRRLRTAGRLCVLLLFGSLGLYAQYLQAVPKPTPDNAEQRATVMWKWLQDWPNLARYRQADQELGAPKAGEHRVVFMGDSITDMWNLAQYFPGKPYVNRGISGQTTSQMLVRFRQDVIDLHPKVVVVLAGTNDIAGNTGPITLEEIERNFQSMSDLAHANGIKLVLSSITPINNYTLRSKLFFAERSPEKIVALNKWLKQYASEHGYMYLDYFTPMVDENGMLKKDLASDGLHPNDTGYKIMVPLAEKAIEQAMAGA